MTAHTAGAVAVDPGGAAPEMAGESRDASSRALASAAAAGAGGPAASPGQAAPASVAGGTELARSAMAQLATAIRSHPGRGEVEIRLDPPELGRVRIGLDIAESGLRASVLADRAATGELLRSHGGVLIQHLQDAGFTEIDLQFGATAQGGHRHGGQAPEAEAARPGATDAPAPAPTRGFASPPSTDGIDLRV